MFNRDTDVTEDDGKRRGRENKREVVSEGFTLAGLEGVIPSRKLGAGEAYVRFWLYPWLQALGKRK